METLQSETILSLKPIYEGGFMKRVKKIIVPTDLSENSHRGVAYGCWLAAEEAAELVILHVANDLLALSFYAEEFASLPMRHQPLPLDRLLAEAALDLHRFLEPHWADLKNVPSARKRVVFGAVADQIAAVASEEKADLVIMSPRRRRGLRHRFFGGITGRVSRLNPCPVLSVTEPIPATKNRGKLAAVLAGWFRPRITDMGSPA